jgi:glyoxylase-like metal-dependent hydrolase (beta-lactamase superfamily II)
MFLVSDDGVIAVDAPPSLDENYIKAIREVTDKPIKYVIYSHSHIDHIGAAGNIYPDNVTIVAQEETAKLLKIANDSNRPIPTVTFKDNYNLTLGNQTLELDYKGVNHEPGNTYIYAPNQKTLMFVDVIFPGWVPFKDLAITKNVSGFVQAHDIVSSYDFDTLVGGHLTRLGTMEDVKIQKEFITDLINASKTANSKINFMDFVSKYGLTNPWLTFSEYADAVTDECTNTMLAKWKDRLGGAEQFTESHCWIMTESQRVD